MVISEFNNKKQKKFKPARKGSLTSMYVYILSEPGLWTVGFYTPLGEWVPESDHATTNEAATRVRYLNGGN